MTEIYRGDIYYIMPFYTVTGSEQRAGRPGVVVSNDINNVHLLLVLRVGSIHHMQNVVRVFCLLERTLKRLDQMVRQLPYKTDRIGQKNLLSARKF